MPRVGVDRFHRTIEAGDLEGVNRLLGEGAPHDRHRHGLTALHLAVSEGTSQRRRESRPVFFAIAQALLDAGADIDGPTREPKTSALQLAMPDEEWVGWLLAHGADPNVYDSTERDRNTAPPLASAILRGSTPLLRQLLAAGAKTDFVCHTTRGNAVNLLEIALENRQAESLDLLLAEARWTPAQLNLALASALLIWDQDAAFRYEAVAKLLRAGARGEAPNPRRFGSSVAFTAFHRQDRRAIELLRAGTAPEVMARLDAWVADRSGRLGLLGFDSPDEEAAERKALSLPPRGVLIQTVVSDGGAERAGLRRREVIVAVNEREVHAFADIRPALAGFQAGQAVAVRIIRDGQQQTVSVVLRSSSGWD